MARYTPPKTEKHAMTLCYCGSSQDFAVCCAPLLEGRQSAATAEALMRARYSAYVTRHIDFIVNSTLPANRSDNDIEATRAWAENAQWDGLEIIATRNGQAEDNRGEVEFIAHYKIHGMAHRHHERSLFVKENGQWFFKDGDVLANGPAEKPVPIVNTNKTGRNDPCPCGSGKKFKKCCGAST
jgi:SEC-C motif-containing protein